MADSLGDFKDSRMEIESFVEDFRQGFSINSDATDAFLKNKLSSVFKEFKSCDTYIAEETGLFWK